MSSFVRVQVGVCDISTDFWVLNEQLMYIEPFKTLYNKKGYQESSRIMWCIWMMLDPDPQNRIRRLPEEDRKDAILSYHPAFDPEDEATNAVISAYPERCLSEAARHFEMEKDMLKQRVDIMKRIQDRLSEMVETNPMIMIDKDYRALWDTLDKMRKSSTSVYQQYADAERLFNLDASESRVYGGRSLTILEKKGLRTNVKEDYEQ